MYKEDLFPFCYEKLGQYYGFLYEYRGVSIPENFGPFIKGQKFDFVWVNYMNNSMKAYNNVGSKNEEIVEFKK